MARKVKQSELHRVVLTAIVYNKEGKYLITKRPLDETAFPGLWTVPGGGLEMEDYVNDKESKNPAGVWYQTLENTLRREVKEETGIMIGRPEYLIDMTFIRPDGVPVVVLSYFAEYVSGEVVLDPKESVDHAWVSAEEAKDYELIDGILEEIESADKIIKSRK